nr:unnamed protein product [Callosobruchus chinensis]
MDGNVLDCAAVVCANLYLKKRKKKRRWCVHPISPFNPIRRACIYLCTNQFFDYIVMATILLNCVFLAMAETIEEAE